MTSVTIDRPAEGVGRIVLSVPETRNAIGKVQRAALARAFAELFDDADVRAIVITGGGGHFSSGGDIRAFGAIEPTEQLANVRAAQALARAMMQGPKPVIAAVEGFAAGAGVGIACASDLIVGDAGSRFVLSFVRIGMTPDFCLHATLPHRLGIARARRAFMLGESFVGEAAFEAGLIDVFAEPGQVQERALALAGELAAGPAVALATYKRGLYLAAGTIDAVAEFEAAAMAVALTGREVREGGRAFLEKRKPDFRGG